MTPPPPPDLDQLLDEIQRRRRARRKIRHRRRRRIVIVVGTLAAVVFIAMLTVGLTGAAAYKTRCSLTTLRPVAIGQNSFIYAADGSLLATIPAERNRQPVPMDRISPWMSKATIAIEDRRFYKHGGVDFEGIARAAWADLRAGRFVQGGSTITQQLVRNLYPVSRERTVKRKLKEACLAVKLSRRWSKDRILNEYMNSVYYGQQAYGIEAAAQTYFSKHARSLSLKDSALLAGLPQAPSHFDPFAESKRALARRDAVLHAMVGTGAITPDKYARVITDRDLHLKRGRLYQRIREPYAFSYVVDRLVQEYGAETVRSGGLRVYTTIDRRLQQAARDAIQRTLYLKDDPASALVAIDPRTGAIRAMTAVTPGRHGNQFNLASQSRRQAGSTFKTFVLTTAIDEGVNPNTTYYTSAPFHYQPDPYTEAWDVQTYDHTYVGSVSIASATLRSDNTVYAQLTLDLGPERVAAVAHAMGIQTSLTTKEGAYVPSMGLGAIAVSPLEMASAYATLAAQGIYSKPWVIRKVVLASGKEDEDAGWGVPERKRVLPDWVAAEVTKILEQNMLSGTGTAAYFGRTAAGKTGTTDKHSDAWFCGYTPNLTTTVWVGYPRAQIPMENVHGIAVAGGTFPAQIWHLFMVRALGDTPPLEWSEPRSSPVWGPFTQGQYARYYTYDSNQSYYSPPAAGSSAATTAARPAPKPATTAAPAPPPATTQPPPVTTEPAPVTTGPEP